MKSPQLNFNGAFAFYIAKYEITLVSTIDHLLNPTDNFESRKVERSLWINDLLYTKSKCLLRINEISDTFDLVKSVNIPCDQSAFSGAPSGGRTGSRNLQTFVPAQLRMSMFWLIRNKSFMKLSTNIINWRFYPRKRLKRKCETSIFYQLLSPVN